MTRKTVLKNVVPFTGLAVNVPMSLPHLLNENNVNKAPELVAMSDEGFTVTANTTKITVVRTTGPDNVKIYCEHWHTIEDLTPAGYVPVPFVINAKDSDGPTPTPPFADTLTTIYARTTGNDTTGIGTLANPYATFTRAIRDVPNIVPPGARYIVDITGVTEALPQNYIWPSIICGGGNDSFFSGTFDVFRSHFEINADLRPVSTAPIILDTDVVSVASEDPAAPNNGSWVITVAPARGSWAGGALTGKFLRTNGGFPFADNGVITNSTNTTITVQCAGGPFVAPPDSAFGWIVSEPSAELISSAYAFGLVGNTISNCPNIGLKGIKFSSSDGSRSVRLVDCGLPIAELCDFSGIGDFEDVVRLDMWNCVLRDNTLFINVLQANKCLFLNVPWISNEGVDHPNLLFRGCTFKNCNTIGGPGDFYFYKAAKDLTLYACTLTDSIGDAIQAGSGRTELTAVTINGAVPGTTPGNAISVDANGFCSMVEVNGSGSAGVGVRVNDGAQVLSLKSAIFWTPTDSTVSGAGGDMRVGTLPARTWLDFRTVAPIANQYDLTGLVGAGPWAGQPVGDEVTGVDTGGRSGSRLSERVWD
jgi:hypothetical protein